MDISSTLPLKGKLSEIINKNVFVCNVESSK